MANWIEHNGTIELEGVGSAEWVRQGPNLQEGSFTLTFKGAGINAATYYSPNGHKMFDAVSERLAAQGLNSNVSGTCYDGRSYATSISSLDSPQMRETLGFQQEIASGKVIMPKVGEYATKAAAIADSLGAKFGAANFLSITSVPIKLVADYKEAMQLVKPMIDNHTLSAEAGRDYADVATKINMMQAVTMQVDPALGYPLFKEWADKNHVPHEIQEQLDPTGVSKFTVDFAPEA